MKQTLGNLLDDITKILHKHNSELMILNENIPDDEYERQCVITSEHIKNNIIPELCLTVDLGMINWYYRR